MFSEQQWALPEAGSDTYTCSKTQFKFTEMRFFPNGKHQRLFLGKMSIFWGFPVLLLCSGWSEPLIHTIIFAIAALWSDLGGARQAGAVLGRGGRALGTAFCACARLSARPELHFGVVRLAERIGRGTGRRRLAEPAAKLERRWRRRREAGAEAGAGAARPVGRQAAAARGPSPEAGAAAMSESIVSAAAGRERARRDEAADLPAPWAGPRAAVPGPAGSSAPALGVWPGEAGGGGG
jgi:hypothetical protein